MRREALRLPSRLRVAQPLKVNHAPGMVEGWPGAIPTLSGRATGTEGWAPGQSTRTVGGEPEPTPGPSRKREGRK
jgi:hypothetical protein